MGFRITISGEDDALLGRLTRDPEDVFTKPYGGYILFLLGKSDPSITKWLLDATIALDSLTGTDVAFAIFLMEFGIKLNVENDVRSHWNPKTSKADIKEITTGHSVERLVKEGRFGYVHDGDMVIAENYAADRIARRLGILDRMPCCVILDAIPSGRFEVYPLKRNALSGFESLVREAIQNMASHPNYVRLMHGLNSLADNRKSEICIREMVRKLDRRIAEEVEASLSRTRAIEQGAAEIQEGLFTGHLKKVYALIRSPDFVDLKPWSEQCEERINAKRDYLLRAAHTAAKLDSFASNYGWPMEGKQRDSYLLVYQKYVRQLLPEESDTPDIEDAKEPRRLATAIRELLGSAIAGILDGGPPIGEAVAKAEAAGRFGVAAIKEEQSKIQQELATLAERSKLLIAGISAMERPSFSHCFQSEVRRRHLISYSVSIGSWILSYLNKWIEPSVVAELAKNLGDAAPG